MKTLFLTYILLLFCSICYCQPYTGWCIESYPEMSKAEIKKHISRQIVFGSNIVWIGHNNPGEVEYDKVEPGLSFAVYDSFISKDKNYQIAKSIIESQYCMLDACKELDIKVVLPVGYQIQMGKKWNKNNPLCLRMDETGKIFNAGGQSACFYSLKYKNDIIRYYNWINDNFIKKYPNIIMINLADEPFGGDYSYYAEKEFIKKYKIPFKSVKTKFEKILLESFHDNYIVNYAVWSSNEWNKINPNIKTTMSFCGYRYIYNKGKPNIRNLFKNTLPNFEPAFDAYFVDGPCGRKITGTDVSALLSFIKTCSGYSGYFNKNYWLWSNANSWGIGAGTINDAIANMYCLAASGAQKTNKLKGIVVWNYNIKGQGLYNDMNKTSYNPDNMFISVSSEFNNIRQILNFDYRHLSDIEISTSTPFIISSNRYFIRYIINNEFIAN